MLNKNKKSTPDKPFMNLSIDEMSTRIAARDQELTRRNRLILLPFLLVSLALLILGIWLYGAWLAETLGAIWLLGLSIWRLEWWAAGQILFHYKLSFFLFGIVAGFFLFLFITFQIGEMLIDLLWDGISALFN